VNNGYRKALENPALLAEVEAIAAADHPLDAIKTFIRRFVSLSEHQARVTAAWVLHTHTVEAAEATPYLAISSAEKQSGKTKLLEVLELLVANPWLTGRVTAAVLFRKIDGERPTLLLDESDAAFNGEKEYAEALRGVLNSGHKPSGKASCCVGAGAEISYKDFCTFCPKAVAGIGRLPDTISDRAIHIRLKRKSPNERIERFRRRNVEPEAAILKSKIESWAATILPGLEHARPELPEELSDRQQDGAEPLLAIGDRAGGDWPAALRTALVAICREARADDGSIGVQLLTDIRNIFKAGEVERISSVDLVASLCEVETSPWSEWSKGKPISAGKLARLLRPFEVAPGPIRTGDRVFKGYTREDFQDAWERYLPAPVPVEAPKTVTKLQPFVFNEIEPEKVLPNENVTLSKELQRPKGYGETAQKTASGAGCNSVTVLTPPTGTEERLFPESEEGEL